MTNKKKKITLFKKTTQLFLLIGVVGVLIPQICFGATAMSRLKAVISSKPSYDVDKTTQNTLTDYVGNIISVFLGLLGSIFVILIVYGGYIWMTAAGNEEKVTRAQQIIKSAVIGIIVLVAVYAIWIFIFARIVKT